MTFELRPEAKRNVECIGMEKKGICPKRNVSVNMAFESHFLQIRVSFPLPPRERGLCEPQKVFIVFTLYRTDFRVRLQLFSLETNVCDYARHMNIAGSSPLIFSISHPCSQNILPMQTYLQPNYRWKHVYIIHLHNVHTRYMYITAVCCA